MSNIVIQRGADRVLDVVVTDDAGTPVSLEGVELLFQARATVQGPVVIEKRTGQGIAHGQATGQATITLTPADTLGAPGQLRYGLWALDPAGRQPLVERGFLQVRDSVVRETL